MSESIDIKSFFKENTSDSNLSNWKFSFTIQFTIQLKQKKADQKVNDLIRLLTSVASRWQWYGG